MFYPFRKKCGLEISVSVISLILLFNLLSCFSSEKNSTTSVNEPSEKTISKDNIGEVKPPALPAEQVSQNTESILIQSSLTPKLEHEKTEESESTIGNTSALQVQPKESKDSEVVSERLTKVTDENVIPAPNEGNVEIDPFNQIQVGMRYDEVVKVIGEPDVLISQGSGGQMKLYRWNREDKSLYARFENGILKRCSRKVETGTGNIIPLTRELYDQLKEGMPLEDVVALLQRPGTKVSSDNAGEVIYLWTDKGGSSFSARFVSNKLVRKSGFYVRPVSVPQVTEEPEEVPQQIEEEVGEGPITEEIGEGYEMMEDERGESYDEQNVLENKTPIQNINRTVPPAVNEERSKIVYNNRRIIYAGERNRGLSETGGSVSVMRQKLARQRVRLPDFTYRLRDGAYEIRINNPLDTSVKVGIRSGKRGKDITLPPNGTRSLKVPKGDYQIFYIRDDDPTTVQQGGVIQIDGLFIGDVEVLLLK
ncbi:MAG: hypothetical protein LDL53_11675 [Candidatus Hydrogenedens sp.]|nr:hypothetical protein [Candidatus Hydrogenedens sp.]